jgi:hypothetical protein
LYIDFREKKKHLNWGEPGSCQIAKTVYAGTSQRDAEITPKLNLAGGSVM